jgi:hypothetical protein
VLDELRAAAAAGFEVARLLEAGQARSPLTDRFVGIAGAQEKCRAVNLVFLSPGLRKAWLASQLGEGGAAAEVRLAAGEALVKIATASGVACLVAADHRAVAASPGLLRTWLAHSNLMFVVGESRALPRGACREALRDLASAACVLKPIVVLESGSPERRPRNGWWSDTDLTAGTELLPHATEASDPFQLGDEIERALESCRAADRLVRSVALGAQQRERAEARNRSRRAALGRRLRTLDDAMGRERELRSQTEEFRHTIQDAIGELENELTDASRRATLPDAPLVKEARRSLGRLAPVDLREEPTTTAIRLSVRDEFIADVLRDLRSAARTGLRNDLDQARRRLNELCERAERRLGERCRAGVSLDLASADEHEIWRSIEELVRVELRYRGERPKRGLLQRLSEGRRTAFMILMFCSLFGGFFSIRQSSIFPFVMLGLFVAGFAHTYVSWKRQDRERIEKELERVKEGLSSELKRLIAEIEREKAARIQVFLADVQKGMLRQVEAALREEGVRRLEGIEREREDLKERSRLMDARARELESWLGALERLSSTADALQTRSREWLRAAIGAEYGRTARCA